MEYIYLQIQKPNTDHNSGKTNQVEIQEPSKPGVFRALFGKSISECPDIIPEKIVYDSNLSGYDLAQSQIPP